MLTSTQRTDLTYARDQLAKAREYARALRVSAALDCIGRATDALERIDGGPCTNWADGIECSCPVCTELEANNNEDRATREPRWLGPTDGAK